MRNYTLRSNNCVLGLKSQFAIITCSHLKPVLRCIPPPPGSQTRRYIAKIAVGGIQGNWTRNRQVLSEIYRVGDGHKKARGWKTIESNSHDSEDYRRNHVHRRRDNSKRVAMPAVCETEWNGPWNETERTALRRF